MGRWTSYLRLSVVGFLVLWLSITSERVPVFAQALREAVVTADLGRGLWQTFDVSDGLPSSPVSLIFQDRAGNLWFGTKEGGVSRYDGARFTTFTTQDGLASNEIIAFPLDRDY